MMQLKMACLEMIGMLETTEEVQLLGPVLALSVTW